MQSIDDMLDEAEAAFLEPDPLVWVSRWLWEEIAPELQFATSREEQRYRSLTVRLYEARLVAAKAVNEDRMVSV